MLTEIAYYQILGKPVIMYLGILTLISFLITAGLGHFGKYNKLHVTFAAISIILALIHGTLGISAYF